MEALKANDQLEWVGRMNSCRDHASPVSIVIFIYLLLILSKVHCILQSFIFYMDKKIYGCILLLYLLKSKGRRK